MSEPQAMALERAADDARVGFRLARLEVFGWGPFRGRVASIRPDGGHAMLAGDIGSGAGALVDALIALLVPARRIASVSCGGDGHAVVLGVFHHIDTDETVTLAQIFEPGASHVPPARWFVGATCELSIDGDFSDFVDDIQALHKSLRAAGVGLFDTVPAYDAWFRRHLGIGDAMPIDDLRACRDALEGYFASMKLALLDERLAHLAEDWMQHDQCARHEAERHAALRAQALHLRHSISANGGERIAQLDIDIEQLECARDLRRQRAAHYATLAAAFGEAPAGTATDFAAQRVRLARRPAATRTQSAALRQLAAFADYQEIDWRPLAFKIARLGDEKQRLQNASDLLQQLTDGLDELLGTIKACEQSLETCRDARMATQTRMALAESLRQETADLLAASEPALETVSLDTLDALHRDAPGGRALTVESCDARREAMRVWLQARINADAINRQHLTAQLCDPWSVLDTDWESAHARSFRLVVIDEAFWRGSDASARGALQRFAALNMQLLIVTPQQRIPMVEPFVSSVAFIHRAADGAGGIWHLDLDITDR
ncbi:ATP-binding protein [Cupriavidus campinensis]